MIKKILFTLVLVALAAAAGGCSFLSLGGSPSQPSHTDEQAKAQLNLAAALLMQGENSRALPELMKAKELAPRNADVENYLGLAYYGLKEYNLAAESFQKALKLDSKRTDVHNNLGLVYLEQQNYDKALAEFNICLKDLLYQKQQLPLSNIGLTYMEMGRYEEALASLKRATEIAPDYPNSYQIIGRVYLKQNRNKEAIDYLSNAARLDPGDPETFMLLGDAYANMNNAEEAASAYSKAATLAPNTNLALEAQKKARAIMGFD